MIETIFLKVPQLNMYISFKGWIDTCNKMLLSVSWYRCLYLAIFTDLFTSSINKIRTRLPEPQVLKLKMISENYFLLSTILQLMDRFRTYRWVSGRWVGSNMVGVSVGGCSIIPLTERLFGWWNWVTL